MQAKTGSDCAARTSRIRRNSSRVAFSVRSPPWMTKSSGRFVGRTTALAASRGWAMGTRGSTTQDISAQDEHAAEDHEGDHEWVAVTVDESERADSDVENSDDPGEDERSRVAGSNARPDPDQRCAEG